MASEWIKIERGTGEKPEIIKLARQLKIDRDLVLGKLVRLWCWFDANSVDGHVDGVASTDVDALVTLPGFAAALKSVGWLDYDDDREVISIPHFERHNGESAKKRALKNARQTRWRRDRDDDVDAKVDAHVDTTPSTDASTREEKRRIKDSRRERERSSSAPSEQNGADKDPRKAIFDLGVELLGQSNRALLGKAIKQVGEEKTAEVIGRMLAKPPAGDPIEYFLAATRPKERGFVC